jgi:phage FluMu protein Com
MCTSLKVEKVTNSEPKVISLEDTIMLLAPAYDLKEEYRYSVVKEGGEYFLKHKCPHSEVEGALASNSEHTVGSQPGGKERGTDSKGDRSSRSAVSDGWAKHCDRDGDVPGGERGTIKSGELSGGTFDVAGGTVKRRAELSGGTVDIAGGIGGSVKRKEHHRELGGLPAVKKVRMIRDTPLAMGVTSAAAGAAPKSTRTRGGSGEEDKIESHSLVASMLITQEAVGETEIAGSEDMLERCTAAATAASSKDETCLEEEMGRCPSCRKLFHISYLPTHCPVCQEAGKRTADSVLHNKPLLDFEECANCKEIFPAEKLSSHFETCRDDDIKRNRDLYGECPYCSAVLPVLDLINHSASCDRTRSPNPVSAPPVAGGAGFDVETDGGPAHKWPGEGLRGDRSGVGSGGGAVGSGGGAVGSGGGAFGSRGGTVGSGGEAAGLGGGALASGRRTDGSGGGVLGTESGEAMLELEQCAFCLQDFPLCEISSHYLDCAAKTKVNCSFKSAES